MVGRRGRRAVSVLLVALAVVGVRVASAGDVQGPWVRVGEDTTAGCGTQQVQVDYDVEYVAELPGYGVSAARLSGLDERCHGHEVLVTLSGPGGVALAELSAQVTGTEMTVVVPAGTPVGAEALTGVSVVLARAGA
ncbi:hypothetical protein [Cellulomonas bogoriensis]|nr:hypothetical protein [Cellulomonas bogoriensis]